MTRPRRSLLLNLAALGLVTVVLVAGFSALGVWQIHRRAWKLDLIAQIDSRIHAAPVAAPGPADWPSITAKTDAYRRVRVRGVFENDRSILVQAATELGSGYWVMTPLRTVNGFTVLVNRGFVPPDQPATLAHGESPAQVVGLLRVTEPKGGFLRSNDPAANRWYSRDVLAIASARHLQNVAPYFIDADGSPAAAGGPVGGLTVVSLANNHLTYLITWFALALLSAGGGLYAIWDATQSCRMGPQSEAIRRNPVPADPAAV